VHGGALPQKLFSENRWLTSLLRRVLSYPDFVVLLCERELVAYRAFARDVRLVMIANAVEIKDVDLKRERNAPDRPFEVVYTDRFTNSKRVFDSVETIGILRSRGIEAHRDSPVLEPLSDSCEKRSWTLGLTVVSNFAGQYLALPNNNYGEMPMFSPSPVTAKDCRARCWRAWPPAPCQ
jgi:hypothetical protein